MDLLVVLLFLGCALLWIPLHSQHFDPEIHTVLTAGGYVFGGYGSRLCLVLLFAFRAPEATRATTHLSALTFCRLHATPVPNARWKHFQKVLIARATRVY